LEVRRKRARENLGNRNREIKGKKKPEILGGGGQRKVQKEGTSQKSLNTRPERSDKKLTKEGGGKMAE